MSDQQDVIHENNAAGSHRLIIDGEAGDWASYDEIAVNGSLRASTDYFPDLPEVFQARSSNNFSRIEG